MKIGLAIDPREPFGLYRLKDIKADSDRCLKPHREHLKRIRQWSEFGITITTMLLATGVIGFFGLSTVGV